MRGRVDRDLLEAALRLVVDYLSCPKGQPFIAFTGVSLYNFVYTGGATITDIEEMEVAELLKQIGAQLEAWQMRQAVDGWRDSPLHFQESLEAHAQRAWRIDSAIGFLGLSLRSPPSRLCLTPPE